MADDLENFLDDEEDEEESAQAPAEDSGSSVINLLRKQLRDVKKRAKTAEEEVAALRPLREQTRVASARDALKAVGLPEQMAGTFAKVHDGEFSEDTARAFAEANGLAPQPKESAPTPEPFVPTSGGEAPGAQKISWAEAMSMLTNPSTKDAALKLYDEGRVADPE